MLIAQDPGVWADEDPLARAGDFLSRPAGRDWPGVWISYLLLDDERLAWAAGAALGAVAVLGLIPERGSGP